MYTDTRERQAWHEKRRNPERSNEKTFEYLLERDWGNGTKNLVSSFPLLFLLILLLYFLVVYADRNKSETSKWSLRRVNTKPKVPI